MSCLGLLAVAALLLAPEHSGNFAIGAISSANSGAHFFGGCVVGFGLLVFALGFHNYRTLRLLGNTPKVAIGDLSVGLVRICGMAVGTEHLISPIAKLPCFYYGVRIDSWRGGKGASWLTALVDTRHMKFHLQDDTGKVLIDLHQAELDLFATFYAEVGPRASKKRVFDLSLGSESEPSDGDLLRYLSQANARIHAEQVVQHESVIHASMNERSFTVLGAEPEVDEKLLRFNEQCLLPDREYTILGTCVDNPDSTDGQDRKLILRGGNWRHFVISCRTEAALQKRTQWTALGLLALGLVMISAGLFVFFALPGSS